MSYAPWCTLNKCFCGFKYAIRHAKIESILMGSQQPFISCRSLKLGNEISEKCTIGPVSICSKTRWNRCDRFLFTSFNFIEKKVVNLLRGDGNLSVTPHINCTVVKMYVAYFTASFDIKFTRLGFENAC